MGPMLIEIGLGREKNAGTIFWQADGESGNPWISDDKPSSVQQMPRKKSLPSPGK